MFFPFEKYIASSDENEYKEDTKKKNSILKFMNSLAVAPEDETILLKLVNIFMYFRNTFTREAFLYFYLNKFDEKERRLINRVVFDLFVASNKGEVGDWKQYYCLCEELARDMDKEENPHISENWEKLKKENSI
jgi:hypothetical protein